jgi:formylglycine-generating enzyme required for sulfatase activity
MTLVPAGPFMMGCNTSIEGAAVCGAPEQADELPYRSVTLNAFLIDKLEASRAKYSECVNAHVCVATGAEMTSNLPVAVTWQQATTYCVWAGKRLPTEAEWEKAARGDDGRTFPWGDSPPNCTLVDFADCGGSYVTVDSLPAGVSPYGALNMAGDISEWVRDLYQSDYYATSPTSNPPGPITGDKGNVLRGGNGISAPEGLRAARRFFGFGGGFGFRCARDY